MHSSSAGDTRGGCALLLTRALQIALDNDLAEDAGVCYFVLSDGCFRRDAYADALAYLDEALALARKLGDRPHEWAVLAERTYPLYMFGRWDEVLAVSDEFTQKQIDAGGVVLSLLQSAVEIHLQRGELDRARGIFSMFSRLETSTDVQDRASYLGSRAALHRAEGRLHEAIADGEAAIETRRVSRHLGSGGQARLSSKRSKQRSRLVSRARSRSC